MRFLIFLLLALAVIEPTYTVLETPRILLVVDDSESTLREDGARCDVDLLAKNLAHAAVVETVSLREFSVYGSPLGDFLRHLAVRDAPAAQMICLISDGIVTRGAALETAQFTQPVTCVALGSDAPLPRISWGIPLVTQTENSWKVGVTLNGHLLRAPQEIDICVREKIAGKSFNDLPIMATTTLTLDEKISWSLEIPHATDEKTTKRELLFSFVPKDFDNASVLFALVPPTTLTVSLTQQSPRVRTLLIEKSPRTEYRFLRETLRRLEECELTTLLLDADANADPLGLFAEADADAQLNEKSFDATLLDKWDLILLGDVELADLPAAFFTKPLIFLLGTQNAEQLRFGTAQFRFGIAEPSSGRISGGFGYTEPNPAQSPEEFPNKSSAELIFADDPLIPPLPNEKLFSLRWSVPLTQNDALRVLASANGKPVIAIDEARRWGWHGTDEFYRVIGVWGDAWYREYWRNLILLLGNSTAQHFSPGQFDSELSDEFKHTARDTNALRTLVTASGGIFFDAQLAPAEEKLEAKISREILTHFARTPHATRTPLISRWLIFATILTLFIFTWRTKIVMAAGNAAQRSDRLKM